MRHVVASSKSALDVVVSASVRRARSPSVTGGQTDIPLASIRLKMIREGFEDYEYLKLASDLGDPAFARQIGQTLFPDVFASRQPPAALRSRACRDMRKLKGDIPASDKGNPSREFVQLQELIAGRQVLSAGNLQICRSLPGRNHDVPSLQGLFPYLYCRWTAEACPTMERGDAGFRELVFAS